MGKGQYNKYYHKVCATMKLQYCCNLCEFHSCVIYYIMLHANNSPILFLKCEFNLIF